MSKDAVIPGESRYHKAGALERAIVNLRNFVTHGGTKFGSQLYLTQVEAAVLLDAARLGMGRIYTDPAILDTICTKGMDG